MEVSIIMYKIIYGSMMVVDIEELREVRFLSWFVEEKFREIRRYKLFFLFLLLSFLVILVLVLILLSFFVGFFISVNRGEGEM